MKISYISLTLFLLLTHHMLINATFSLESGNNPSNFLKKQSGSDFMQEYGYLFFISQHQNPMRSTFLFDYKNYINTNTSKNQSVLEKLLKFISKTSKIKELESQLTSIEQKKKDCEAKIEDFKKEITTVKCEEEEIQIEKEELEAHKKDCEAEIEASNKELRSKNDEREKIQEEIQNLTDSLRKDKKFVKSLEKQIAKIKRIEKRKAIEIIPNYSARLIARRLYKDPLYPATIKLGSESSNLKELLKSAYLNPEGTMVAFFKEKKFSYFDPSFYFNLYSINHHIKNPGTINRSETINGSFEGYSLQQGTCGITSFGKKLINGEILVPKESKLEFNFQKKCLLMYSSKDGVSVFKTDPNYELKFNIKDSINIAHAQFSPKGSYIVGFKKSTNPIEDSMKAYLWNSESNELIRTFNHRSPIRKIYVSDDDETLITKNEHNQTTWWDIKTGIQKNTPTGEGPIENIIFGADDKTLRMACVSLSEDRNSTNRLLDLYSKISDSYEKIASIEFEGNIESLSFDPSNNSNILLFRNGRASFLRYNNSTFNEDVIGNNIKNASFNFDGSMILLVDNQGVATIVDAKTKELIVKVEHGSSIDHAQLDRHGALMTANFNDTSDVKIWDISGAIIKNYYGSPKKNPTNITLTALKDQAFLVELNANQKTCEIDDYIMNPTQLLLKIPESVKNALRKVYKKIHEEDEKESTSKSLALHFLKRSVIPAEISSHVYAPYVTSIRFKSNEDGSSHIALSNNSYGTDRFKITSKRVPIENYLRRNLNGVKSVSNFTRGNICIETFVKSEQDESIKLMFKNILNDNVFNAQGNLMLTLSKNSMTLHNMTLSDNNEIRTFTNNSTIDKATFSSDSKKIAAFCFNKCIVWSSETGEELFRTISEIDPNYYVENIKFSDDDSKILISTNTTENSNSKIYILDSATGEITHTFSEPSIKKAYFPWNKSDSLIIFDSNSVGVYNLKTNKYNYKFNIHDSNKTDINCDATMILINSGDKTIIWSLIDESEIYSFKHENASQVKFDNRGLFIVTTPMETMGKNKIKLWDITGLVIGSYFKEDERNTLLVEIDTLSRNKDWIGFDAWMQENSEKVASISPVCISALRKMYARISE